MSVLYGAILDRPERTWCVFRRVASSYYLEVPFSQGRVVSWDSLVAMLRRVIVGRKNGPAVKQMQLPQLSGEGRRSPIVCGPSRMIEQEVGRVARWRGPGLGAEPNQLSCVVTAA
jgi:hypothetical protein